MVCVFPLTSPQLSTHTPAVKGCAGSAALAHSNAFSNKGKDLVPSWLLPGSFGFKPRYLQSTPANYESAGTGGEQGRRMVNVLPLPTSLSTAIVPLCASMM